MDNELNSRQEKSVFNKNISQILEDNEKMIKAAKSSGADYAKFQTWSVKNLKNGPWDKDGRREIYEKAELGREDYIKISKICKKYKIKFLTSLFNHDDYQLIKLLFRVLTLA